MTSAPPPPGFDAHPPLLAGQAWAGCRASITIPARNEEAHLRACLDALAAQTDLRSRPLSLGTFEILLLLNNCTDASAAVARAWQATYPHIDLHIVERTLPAAEAHVGTARRLLMDTAWHRLQGSRTHPCAILSTDADTLAAPDWVAQTLLALDSGAEAIGGLIEVHPSDLQALPPQVRCCYQRHRHYEQLIAQLEDLLDPQPGDPWPRHLDHFGSSLACTPAAYARAGGMPAIPHLEDAAFVDRLLRAEVRLRHEPRVRVYTSARLDGRAPVGMAGQLRLWSELTCDDDHVVHSAALLERRFRTLRLLRKLFAAKSLPKTQETILAQLPTHWHARLLDPLAAAGNITEYFIAVQCNWLVWDTFAGLWDQPIRDAILALQDTIEALTPPARSLQPTNEVLAFSFVAQ